DAMHRVSTRLLIVNFCKSSVYQVIATGNKTRFIRTKIKRQCSDLFRFTHTTNRLTFGQFIKYLVLLTGVVFGDETVHKRRMYPRRRNAVAADVVVQVVARNR